MPTPPAQMTDLQLDTTLDYYFTQHKGAKAGRRAVIHRVIMDALAEQKVRRDEVLGLSAANYCSRAGA